VERGKVYHLTHTTKKWTMEKGESIMECINQEKEGYRNGGEKKDNYGEGGGRPGGKKRTRHSKGGLMFSNAHQGGVAEGKKKRSNDLPALK